MVAVLLLMPVLVVAGMPSDEKSKAVAESWCQ
jgi:hypothetical protein